MLLDDLVETHASVLLSEILQVFLVHIEQALQKLALERHHIHLLLLVHFNYLLHLFLIPLDLLQYGRSAYRFLLRIKILRLVDLVNLIDIALLRFVIASSATSCRFRS